jgi:hypothetical protein
MNNNRIRIMLLLLCSVLMVNASSSLSLGVKSGDWVAYDFQEAVNTGAEQWQTMEFLNIVGTNVTIRVTIHWAAGLEMNQTRTIDMSSNDDFQYTINNLGVRAYIIPSNLGVGASVYLGGLGNQTIAGEATGNVAGTNRRLVYANFSQGVNLYTFYWDEETGVLVEGIESSETVSNVVLATETNMWSADFVWWPWIIIIIIIVCSIIISRKNIAQKLRRKPNASSDS